MESYQIKVYKIVNDETDKIYVGSTKQSLTKRFLKHKSDYTTMNNGNKCSYCTSFILFDRYGTENCHIILLQEYSLKSKEEQIIYERMHYDDLKEFIVNKIKPHATFGDKSEQNKKDCKKYRESHKEQVAIDKKK